MTHLEEIPPVKTGTWQYAGTVACGVRIVQHDTYYGTGDYEDPTEWADDRSADCYYLFYGTPIGEPKWAGGSVAFSLADAIKIAEETLGASLVWGT